MSSSPALRALLVNQRAAQLRDGPPTAEIRVERLNRCIALLVDGRTRIEAALAADFGARSPYVTAFADIASSIGPLKHARDNVARWMHVERRPTSPRILGWLGAKPAEGIYTVLGRVFTFFYFAYFLIVLPMLSRMEKTLPLPNSISDDVLAKSSGKLASVAVIAAYLAFFPVAMGTLRGLQSTSASSLELMDSFAAGWWKTLLKLRFPSAVPYIAPALRLAGAASVVGVTVSEISLGIKFGIGRLILSYGQEASSDPPKLFTAVFGAAALGLVMAALVVAIDRRLMRNRPPEAA